MPKTALSLATKFFESKIDLMYGKLKKILMVILSKRERQILIVGKLCEI